MSAPGERLSVLAALVGGDLTGDVDPIVTDVTHDSRQVVPGSLFLAVRGSHTDGHEYLPDVVAAGAVAAVVSDPVQLPIPVVTVPDVRAVMAPIAAAVHGRPSEQVPVHGVTGTNGKTTVTHMLEHVLTAAGHTVGLIGTIHTRIGHDEIPATHTTPEATDLQRLLRNMIERGADTIAAEVSSHALVLGRAEEVRFDVVAFTNLSRDHLDFHADMEDYFAAKARLFEAGRARVGVVWVDDPWGARLAATSGIPVTTVGTTADVVVRILHADLRGSDIEIDFGNGARRVRVPLAGDFNVANAAVAATMAVEAGIDVGTVCDAIASTPGIPGRFELVSEEDPIAVLVDFAHTPDGIRQVIATLRGLVDGRIVAVVGAGGDRDRSKRPLMGAAASAADVAVVTSDNPRSEDPDAIIDAVMAGIEPGTVVERRTDRREAIELALSMADDGDAVVVLGKGHERGQEIAGRKLPFDDRIEARRALEERRAR